MGILLNGPNGPVIGKVGANVSYMLNGRNVIRIHPNKGKRNVKSLSLKQQANCMQMSVINELFEELKPLLKVGFSAAAAGTAKNYHNIATALNKPGALKGEFPNIEIDYQKLLISIGNLPLPSTTAVDLDGDNLIFSWSTDQNEVGISPQDQAMILVFFPENKESISFCYSSMRSEGQKIIALPDYLSGKVMETYLSFVSDDRTRVATSLYMGRIN
ncbi:hypothetical protein ACVWYN_003662 [Pedobacter sp. UYP24]